MYIYIYIHKYIHQQSAFEKNHDSTDSAVPSGTLKAVQGASHMASRLGDGQRNRRCHRESRYKIGTNI